MPFLKQWQDNKIMKKTKNKVGNTWPLLRSSKALKQENNKIECVPPCIYICVFDKAQNKINYQITFDPIGQVASGGACRDFFCT